MHNYIKDKLQKDLLTKLEKDNRCIAEVAKQIKTIENYDFEIDEFFQRIGLHVAVKEIKFHCFRVAEGVDPYRFGGNLLLGAFTQTYRQIKI